MTTKTLRTEQEKEIAGKTCFSFKNELVLFFISHFENIINESGILSK